MSQPVNWIVDLDLAQFFDTMPHLEILTHAAADQGQEISTVARMLKADSWRLCRVNWEVRKARFLPGVGEYILDQVLDQWFMTVVSTAEDTVR